MNLLIYLTGIPFVVGLVCLIIPKNTRAIREFLALAGAGVTFYLSIIIFLRKPVEWSYNNFLLLRVDNVSGFILLAVGLFGFLIILYSLKFIAGKERLKEYYAYFLWTIGGSCAALLANNLILLLAFWGFLGLTLYLLIGVGGPEASPAAKKSLIIVGGSDCLMILGIGIIWLLTGSLQMDNIRVHPGGSLPMIAFVSLVIASFAKAGAMPLHTWIPDCAEKAPIPVTAFLPASLDKLLGIYLLVRIVTDIFAINKAMSILLLATGAVTVIAAVMMALVQHDLKKLLSYHAVSQVGYMVLGIGTGNPIGIAGGIFHMLNNAIYKSCLFLTSGAVENKTRTTDLNSLGGLAKVMPITFVACLISALSISGVPPFNGFISKWMVYQGVIELNKTGDRLWIVWLASAMFGSALTLASFMKVLHCVFLGAPSPNIQKSPGKQDEVGFAMWFPMVVLAGLCIIFGVFAYKIPLRHLIAPAVRRISFLGFWSPGLATLLIITGIIIGVIVYRLGSIKSLRTDITYVGGEIIPEDARVTGADFYVTIKELGAIRQIYEKAEKKTFDIYDQGTKFIFFLIKGLQNIHNGVLPFYLFWALFGMLILFMIVL